MNAPATQHVFEQPGPFQITRIVEMEGAFLPAARLFPDATPELIDSTDTAQDPRLYDRAAGLLVMSFHSLVVRTSKHTILVDTSVGNDKERPRNPPWHQLKGSYLSDMAAAGLAPEDIDIVLCTHLHADHVGWNTHLVDGAWVPTFPNARYLFGRKEVAHWRQALSENEPDMVNHGSWADSVQPIFEAGLVEIIDEDQEVVEGIRVLPAPGHTPGNMMVKIEDQGESAYLTGDVIHHPIQIERPEWSSCFCEDMDLSAKTRTAMLAAVADEDAWLMSAHFPTPTATKIRRTATGFRMGTDA